MKLKITYLLSLVLMSLSPAIAQTKAIKGNPVITDKYTADPAAVVIGDSVYLYVGHDQAAANATFYAMDEWLVYSSANMVDWTAHPSPLNPKAFSWSKGDAWASQVIERNGKFYWYVAVEHQKGGKAIGVAVSDSPLGPFKDAIGKALITNDMTTEVKISWDDIDPTVIIDDDGQAYLFWGNSACYYAKLSKSMTEFDGEIKVVKGLPNFTEAPWIHKRKGWYYLSYAVEFPEKIAYSMSRSINGPWVYKGILNELAGNSNTNHQSIISFKGKDYFIYHNGGKDVGGGSFRRSVCIDRLYYNGDGSIKRIIMTTEGLKK
ncbi:glycoside hydrolase family 43 protein [Pedobacter sp. PWIIR3]